MSGHDSVFALVEKGENDLICAYSLLANVSQLAEKIVKLDPEQPPEIGNILEYCQRPNDNSYISIDELTKVIGALRIIADFQQTRAEIGFDTKYGPVNEQNRAEWKKIERNGEQKNRIISMTDEILKMLRHLKKIQMEAAMVHLIYAIELLAAAIVAIRNKENRSTEKELVEQAGRCRACLIRILDV